MPHWLARLSHRWRTLRRQSPATRFGRRGSGSPIGGSGPIRPAGRKSARNPGVGRPTIRFAAARAQCCDRLRQSGRREPGDARWSVGHTGFDQLNVIARRRRFKDIKRHVGAQQIVRDTGFDRLHLQLGAGPGKRDTAIRNCEPDRSLVPALVRSQAAKIGNPRALWTCTLGLDHARSQFLAAAALAFNEVLHGPRLLRDHVYGSPAGLVKLAGVDAEGRDFVPAEIVNLLEWDPGGELVQSDIDSHLLEISPKPVCARSLLARRRSSLQGTLDAAVSGKHDQLAGM